MIPALRRWHLSTMLKLILILSALSHSAHASEPGAPDALAPFTVVDAAASKATLIHIRVIDGTGAAPLEDQSVEIDHGRITAVRPTAPGESANGKTVLDMSGRTVLPGLVGMHDHLFYVARTDDDAEIGHAYPTLLPQMSYSAPRLYLAQGCHDPSAPPARSIPIPISISSAPSTPGGGSARIST